MNIGAALAPDAALASVVSTILVIVEWANVTTGIAIAIPLAAGQVLTYVVRAITVGFQHAADKSIEDGNLTRLVGSTVLRYYYKQCVSLFQRSWR